MDENNEERGGKVEDNLDRNGQEGTRSCGVAEYYPCPREIKGKEEQEEDHNTEELIIVMQITAARLINWIH